MDVEEIPALIRFVEMELQKAGLSIMLGPDLYLDRRDGVDEGLVETGSPALDMSPERAYLLGLLEAFDRHLAVQDDALRIRSIELINEQLIDGHLEDVVMLMPTVSGEPKAVHLRGLEGVGQLREQLSEIIAFVRSAEPQPETSPEW